MRRLIAAAAALAIVGAGLAVAASGHDTSRSRENAKTTIVSNLWFELVGQFQNSATGVVPVTHIHYGYLSWVQGVSPFGAAPQDEKSAIFTFFADGKTSPIQVNGPLRFGTRVGTLTVYRDPSTNSDFANPDTFRDGTPVL